MDKIAIIDYGLGNLYSVERAVLVAGGLPYISRDPEKINTADKLILPGVGAFKAGMDGLRKYKLIEPIKDSLRRGTKLLGLCLGMQLLFETSEEFGIHEGLSVIPGVVKLMKFSPREKHIKIPHIGWNSLLKPKGVHWRGTVLEDVKSGEMAYFVHSFVAHPKNHLDCLAETEYGGETFCSVVLYKNILGTQFHPEKSGNVGLKILRRFIIGE